MKRKNILGFSLLEVLVALGISSGIMVAGSAIISGKSDDITVQGAAQYQAMISNASIKYIQANFAEIKTAATDTVPAKITFSQLKAKGYIPTNFATTSINAYGQTSCVLVLEPTAGKLRALVVTEGGGDIPSEKLAYLASQVGLSGGYIAPDAPTLAKGAYGSWEQNITNFVTDKCSGTAAGPNHLASLIQLDETGVLQDYVYRDSIPNQPNAGRLSTTLLMSAVMPVAQPCVQIGAFARDGDGNLLVCNGSPLKWNALTNGGALPAERFPYWGAPVTTVAELNTKSCTSANSKMYRIVTTPTVGTKPIPYQCRLDGSTYSWFPSGVGDDGKLFMTFDNLNTFKITRNETEGADCDDSIRWRYAKDPVTGALLTCAFMQGKFPQPYKWRRPDGEPYRSVAESHALFKYFGDRDMVGQIRTTERELRAYMYHVAPGPAVGFEGDKYIPLARGPNVNGTAEKINQIDEDQCDTPGCVATINCSVGTRITSTASQPAGMCSGAAVDIGVASGASGWSCTALPDAGSKVKALVFCN